MKASDLLVKALENEGVEYIFGVPGEENLDFLESLRSSSIKLVVTRHEQVAGFMAATFGRLTGKPGVCLSTLGPGATNLVTAAAYATLGGMPMVMITGQKPIKSSKQGHFQIINVPEMMSPVTKSAKQIINANLISPLVREAFRIATEERPGAVHLELPEDVAREEADQTNLFAVGKVRRPIAENKAVLEAVEMIRAAKRPLLLIGAGANRKLTAKMLLHLVDTTGMYFFETQMGKGVIDERHSRYIGTAALSSHDLVHAAVQKADLIINVGHDVIEKPPFIMERNGQKVIHVNFYGAKVDNVYFPQLEVVGDIANAIWQITEKLRTENFSVDSSEQVSFATIKQHIEAETTKDSEEDTFPLSPGRIVSDIRRTLNENAIVTLDNGMYKLWFARNYRTYAPNTFLLDNALATMGAGLPSAIATKMLFPEKQVVAVCGDGGFMMNSQDLETAVRLGLDLVIVILNDSGYGMIKWKQGEMELPSFGLDFGNPDFVKYAEAYGAYGYRIESANDFASQLQRCLQSKGVHVIEVPIDYKKNTELIRK